jgi:tripartite-type tricarboxylate transporter receptor subunit TctC
MALSIRNSRTRAPALAFGTSLLLLSSVAAGCTNGDSASSEEGEFYEGKSIEIVVPASPGGGADATASLMAPYLEKHVPGNPSVQVVYEEGGAGIPGSNTIMTQREPDGESILFTFPTNTVPFLVGQAGVEYDLTEMEPVTAFPNGAVVYTSPSTGVEEPADLEDPEGELIYGDTSPVGFGLVNLLMFEVLGIRGDIQQIFGYEGGGDTSLAFERGELSVGALTSIAYKSGTGTDLEEAGKAVPVFTAGSLTAEGELERDPLFPDVPSVREAHMELHGEEPSGEAWDAFLTMALFVNSGGFSMTTHPDTPPEALEALRGAIPNIVDDPDFAEDAEAVLGENLPLVGDEFAAYQESLAGLDEGSLDWMRQFLEENYEVDLG